MENILEIKNLNKEYKNFSLRSVSLNLPKGFIMGLIGENGAGKSTLIKIIMNLVKRDSGSINIFGMDNLKFERKVKERIGFVYDQCYYYDHISLEENGKMVAKLYSNWDNEKFNRYLNKFSLNKKQLLKELSKGMRMKFSLCIALSHGAELIIMDEPTAGLDPIVRNEVLEELQRLLETENLSVIISTHITEDLEKIADYITFIKDGEIVFSTSKDEIEDNYRIVKGSKDVLTKEVESLFQGVSKNNYGFEAITNKGDEISRLLGDKVILERAALEDIMLLYKK
ncbi:ABC transporter ATP-binding protein [Clostridium culturomicium]|uniref:ABC transporter ATP-binding protein n=1 Tax=Clostridium culturomicium TaxID=1499683 RepID=UPI00058EFDED|nr:ABC transporter ATP-binding protein [Clostridium culturomicium]